MLKIVEILDRKNWDDFVNRVGHPLQLWGWGELKEKNGWKVIRVFVKNNSDILGSAQILIKELPFPLRNFAYIPRGAITLSNENLKKTEVLEEITDFVKNKVKPRPVCLSVEPDWEFFPNELLKKGWRKTKNTILIPRTLILDLTNSEEELLSQMNKKTRQYIRKSANQISVREITLNEEIEQALDIYIQTARRAGFSTHNKKYYRNLKQFLGENSPIYGAFINEKGEEKEMVAFLWNIKSQKTSFELYGGISEKGQKLRANFILKWYAIQQMKKSGVERYDFNGLLNDGISKFKSGFSKKETLLCGTFDRPFSILYPIWSNFLPTGKKIVRFLRKK